MYGNERPKLTLATSNNFPRKVSIIWVVRDSETQMHVFNLVCLKNVVVYVAGYSY